MVAIEAGRALLGEVRVQWGDVAKAGGCRKV